MLTLPQGLKCHLRGGHYGGGSGAVGTAVSRFPPDDCFGALLKLAGTYEPHLFSDFGESPVFLSHPHPSEGCRGDYGTRRANS